ncbi:penicillin-insensitive murein endopeptidase [Halobacteriovorax sp. HLS]|uniref:penicillin-insensitive murein endopeptidase n=1 Tax=Halobacteriovorax sp. HLS TaxID=2234000 RepID=UPI000FD989FA|nr:penicillin-insensitive murein endopeptidase [Halobacteriovorax sp. HLS]
MKIFTKIILPLSFMTSVFASTPIGYYSKGKIENSQSIDQFSGHFEKLFRGRSNLYATEYLLSDVVTIAEDIKSNFSDVEKLQIGDISSLNGGNIPRHASHQNGLDIDIVYLRVNKTPQSTTNPEWGEDFTNGKKVSKNFSVQRNWKLFTNIVSMGNVGRIFVDWSVKTKFCEIHGTSQDPLVKETLRRLRPAKYHKTHFHLRLECPKDAPKCRKQDPPANNTGCNNMEVDSL